MSAYHVILGNLLELNMKAVRFGKPLAPLETEQVCRHAIVLTKLSLLTPSNQDGIIMTIDTGPVTTDLRT